MNAPLNVIQGDSPPTAGKPGGGKAPALELDPRTYARGLSCVHCGLCLPACPTYTTTMHEADSPRGRIQLMMGLADGKIELTPSVKEHLDLCLDCRACETACPSGVVYHELIEETRAKLDAGQRMTVEGRFMRGMFFHVFTRPGRLRLALLPARVLQKAGVYGLLRKIGLFTLLPGQMRKMEQMLPSTGSVWPRRLPALTPATGEVRNQPAGEGRATRTVAFFPGCIGSVMFAEVNKKAVEVLSACGAEVVVPSGQQCCGAIHHHNGAHHTAAELAKRNIDVLLTPEGRKVDYIVDTIAGCGAMLREYDHLLRDDADYAWRAKEFVKRVRDISEIVMELGLPEMRHAVNETVTYHDACHLAHAQKVTSVPRKLLAQVPGLKINPLPEADMCCGAAGTYNLTQPEMATKLAERKLENIAVTKAGTCATGNVGCAMHIQSQAEARGQRLKVVHPIELVHRAIFGR